MIGDGALRVCGHALIVFMGLGAGSCVRYIDKPTTDTNAGRGGGGGTTVMPMPADGGTGGRPSNVESIAISGPASVDALTYRLDYTVPMTMERTYRWRVSGADSCFNTAGMGCVLSCAGCEITATSSTGYNEWPSSHFYIAAPASGSFEITVDELAGRDVVRSGTLAVKVIAGPYPSTPRGAPASGSGAFWRVPVAERFDYPTGRVHSPMPSEVTARLRSLASHAAQDARANAFIKVGDSITVASAFLGGSEDPVNLRSCWQDGPIDGEGPFRVSLPDDADLIDTIRHFRTGVSTAKTPNGTLETSTSLGRSSLSARVGASAEWALEGDQPPLDLEISAQKPLFAWVAYGTNDIGRGGAATSDFAVKLRDFQSSFFALVDRIASRGIVPVFRTVPPRLDEAGEYQYIVPAINALIRAKAISMQMPLVDFYEALVSSPNLRQPAGPATHAEGEWGISDDGIHPTSGSYDQFCLADTEHTDAGLHTGYAVEALSALRGLHRAVQAVVAEADRLDDDATLVQPNRVDTRWVTKLAQAEVWSWADVRSTEEGVSQSASYVDCAAVSDTPRGADSASGPALDYSLELARTTRLRALVLDGKTAQYSIYLLSADGTCRYSGADMLWAQLPAGTYTVRVHAAQTPSSGEVAVLIAECDPTDTRCGGN
jgi:lysophospholipase L1-like esterase